ncbi:MAG: hypothetical protein AAF989_05945 [Planctomycetota bacterium]
MAVFAFPLVPVDLGCSPTVSMDVTPRRKSFRFSIVSVLLFTTIVALVIRLWSTSGVVELTFIDLQFESSSGTAGSVPTVPAAIARLHDRQVRIRGYIDPISVFQNKGIKNFILCRDDDDPPSSMDDSEFAVVRMKGQSTIDYTSSPVAVRGTLKILSTPFTIGKRRIFYEIAATEAE